MAFLLLSTPSRAAEVTGSPETSPSPSPIAESPLSHPHPYSVASGPTGYVLGKHEFKMEVSAQEDTFLQYLEWVGANTQSVWGAFRWGASSSLTLEAKFCLHCVGAAARLKLVESGAWTLAVEPQFQLPWIGGPSYLSQSTWLGAFTLAASREWSEATHLHLGFQAGTLQQSVAFVSAYRVSNTSVVDSGSGNYNGVRVSAELSHRLARHHEFGAWLAWNLLWDEMTDTFSPQAMPNESSKLFQWAPTAGASYTYVGEKFWARAGLEWGPTETFSGVGLTRLQLSSLILSGGIRL